MVTSKHAFLTAFDFVAIFEGSAATLALGGIVFGFLAVLMNIFVYVCRKVTITTVGLCFSTCSCAPTS